MQQGHRGLAGDRFDASKVRSDRRLSDDLDGADVARGAYVRASAQLHRGTSFQDPDHVAVLVAEERDRAERLSLVLGGLEGPHRTVRERLGVGEPFDLGDLLGGHRGVVREVETKAIGTDVRTRLLDVLTKHRTQRPVQHMGTGVIAADRRPPTHVDRGGRLLTGGDRAGHPASQMTTQVRQRVGGVEHLESARLCGDRAGVADLASGLGVEGGAVEEHLDESLPVGAVDVEQFENTGLRDVLDISGELGGAEALEHLAVSLRSSTRRRNHRAAPPSLARAAPPSRR